MSAKIAFVFFSFLMLNLSGFCQKEWAPIGAKWYMNVSVDNGNAEPPLKNYYVIESKKDTIIGSVTYRLVGDYPMLQEGGKIYYYYKDSLRLIYDFDVSIDDTVTFNMLDCANNVFNMKYIVTSIDSVLVQNDTLKRVKCNMVHSEYFNPNTYEYIEKIGAKRIPVENLAGCVWLSETTPSWLRCYQDDEIYYKTERFKSYGDLDCDFAGIIDGIKTNKAGTFNLFPNPVKNTVKILGIESPGYLTVYDLTGKILIKKFVSGEIELDIGYFEAGIYFARFHSHDGNFVTSKLVKL